MNKVICTADAIQAPECRLRSAYSEVRN